MHFFQWKLCCVGWTYILIMLNITKVTLTHFYCKNFVVLVVQLPNYVVRRKSDSQGRVSLNVCQLNFKYRSGRYFWPTAFVKLLKVIYK